MDDLCAPTAADTADPSRSLEQARALDPERYVGSDALAFDQREILSRGWQVVAPASALSGPGDHIVREIGGVPILLVRNAAGRLNGFLNICRHRAGPLALCDGKGAKRLRCAYHGWAYDLDGQLRTAPEMQSADGFDVSGIALERIEVEVWGGMVFARIRSGPSLDEVMTGMDGMVDPASLAALSHHHARTYDVACNWKIYVDNYLEGYHLPFVHPDLTQIVSYPDYKTELARFWSLQRSPIDAETDAYAAGEALYFFIYPNTMLNILPGRMQTNRVVANGPDACHVEFDFYYAPGEADRAEADDAFSDRVQDEDRMICEHVQKGLASGAYQPGRLSPDQEAGVWHWHNLLRDAYAACG
ncbi:aromatic ring-hydroxylating oxygenase subunit alpha [Maricaulis sp.]|uniref:aromatic ring-hydroxylating oxygenase subunit alpha n=1 Tax=Maricaulis sp. TaxID=1486257 RepID=UPI002B26B1C4|nr:SRPBCC family protein [Maricaulis sp.]